MKPLAEQGIADSLPGRLRSLRENLGLVQQDIADLFHTNRNVASQWETGQRQPSFDHLLLLADFYGVTIDWMLGRPQAPQDDQDMVAAKEALHDYLRQFEPDLQFTPPADRLRVAVEFLSTRDPKRLSVRRIAAQLLISEDTLRQMCLERIMPTAVAIQRFAQFVRLPEVWFYQPEPRMGDPFERYRPLVERLSAEAIPPETVEQRMWGSRRRRR